MVKLFRRFLILLGLKKAKATFLIVGLDNSGKTTLASVIKGEGGARLQGAFGNLQQGEPLNIEPTVGFRVQNVVVSSRLHLTIVDMSGQQCYRELWETYYEDVQGILFVVDAADPKRFDEAKEALSSVVKHDELERKPLLLFSNKMDLRNAPTAAQVAKSVGMDDLGHHLSRAWRLQGCSAITGEGVGDGLKWLISQVKTK